MDNRDVMPEECESRRYSPLQPGHPVTRLQMQLCECTLQRERPKVASGERGGEKKRCPPADSHSGTISGCLCVSRLQLQRCEYTMQAARPRGRLGSNGSAAIVDARLQLQNPWLQLQNIRLQL